jgi:dCTP deaminase
LVDHAIQDRVRTGDLTITNFADDCVQPASYDLRIGAKILAPSQPDKAYNMASNGGAYRLPPYGVAVLETYEDLKLPNNVLGRIGLKSSFARKGLLASTGPQIDPGFEGKLFISLFNLTAGAHVLKYKDSFLTIEFHTLDDVPTHSYAGPYQSKYSLGPEVLDSVVRLEGLTLSQMQSQFTELAKHVEKWSAFAGRFDEFLNTMNEQATAIRELVSLVKSPNSPVVNGAEAVVASRPPRRRNLNVDQAASEILILFKKKKKLYYSDIAEELSIDLRLVIKACELLEKRGLIEGATNVTSRVKKSRR